MLGKTYDSETCSAARALELVGERWSLLIIRNALFAGATRYNDFLSLGIATNVLKTRLDGFIAAGIMERRGSARGPEQHDYVLTDKGRDLVPVIVALTEWGDRWAAPLGPPILYTHSVCGGSIRLQNTCTACGEVRDPAEVGVRPGPGMPADIAERMNQAAGNRATSEEAVAADDGEVLTCGRFVDPLLEVALELHERR